VGQRKDDLGFEKEGSDQSTALSGDELQAMNKELHTKLHMCSTQDGLDEHDWEHFSDMNRQLGIRRRAPTCP